MDMDHQSKLRMLAGAIGEARVANLNPQELEACLKGRIVFTMEVPK
jgi:hypothetical protein